MKISEDQKSQMCTNSYCCCKCASQYPVFAHPWNKDPFKGSILKQIGWGCLIEGRITFFDFEHSECEMFIPKYDENDFPSALKSIDAEIGYIFDNEELFLERFAKGNIINLTTVSFTGTSVKIVYVLDCGQHVSDSIPMADYLAWRWK